MNHLRLSILTISLFFVGAVTVKLEGGTVTGLSGNSVTLKCDITDLLEQNISGIFYTWNNEENDLLFFGDQRVQALERMSSKSDVNEMEMTIDAIELEDEGKYICKLQGLEDGAVSADVNLIVNQLPKSISVENIDVKPTSGTSATVAKCHSNASKPEVLMWFTDDSEKKVETTATVQTTTDDDGLSYSVLPLNIVFHKSDNGRSYYCHVKHKNKKDSEQRITNPVNVQYPPSASLSEKPDELITLEEGTSFSVTCHTDGNPAPTVTWTFAAHDEVNVSDPNELPKNFVLSGDGKTLRTDGVELTIDDSTNNGTFTCSVSNGLGADVVLSLDLGVYVMPTTVPTTTAEVTPFKEPRAGGSDAAVIGGVVAVALFVLIVAIVLIVRYFMAHKGTYRTNEKVRNVEENRGDSLEENRAMMTDDDDENGLVEKKRTEYFM